MKTLFLFWHGIGDNILATPAIKAYKKQTGDTIGWMMMRRFKSADLFKDNPYIDNIHWCSDAWNDFGNQNISKGSKMVKLEAEKIKKEFGYDKIIVIDHKSGSEHKIYRTAKEMGIEVEDTTTEVYYKNKTIPFELPNEYVFFSGLTGVPSKNLPIEYIKKYMIDNNIGHLPIVSPDFTWNIKNHPISVSCEIMKKAKHIFVADSASYHAAHALNLNIDIAYFQRGESIWSIVHPLHSGSEKVIYHLV